MSFTGTTGPLRRRNCAGRLSTTTGLNNCGGFTPSGRKTTLAKCINYTPKKTLKKQDNLPDREHVSRFRARHYVAVIACVALLGSVTSAAQIDGTVVIRRKLTKRSITSANAYSRGPAVALPANLDQDPLSFERRHVVVYVEEDRSPSTVEAKIEQQNRRFSPDLVVVPAGSTVTFPNQDAIFHNVFSLSKAKSFDLGNYSKGQTRVVSFPRPGIVYVNCHLHPNMSATIFVTPNGWATTADASGHFTLDLPPGHYTLVAWHKAAGFFKQSIDVSDGPPSKAVFLVPLAEDGSALNAENK